MKKVIAMNGREEQMDDLIKRQDAITAYCEHECGKGMIRGECGCDDCATIFDDIPSAQQEQQWTPCSERPPKKNGRYLVTRGLRAAGALWNRVYIVNYSDLMGIKSEKIWWQGNVGKSDFERIDDVIAWTELPEPYKGEES